MLAHTIRAFVVAAGLAIIPAAIAQDDVSEVPA